MTALSAIGQIALRVTQADRAETWFRDTLGLPLLFRFDDQPHLIARMPDHELWMASCKDPDGNPFR